MKAKLSYILYVGKRRKAKNSNFINKEGLRSNTHKQANSIFGAYDATKNESQTGRHWINNFKVEYSSYSK